MTKIPGVQVLNRCNLGDGTLLLGTANSAYNNLDFNEVGAIAATATFTIEGETKALELGSPQRRVKTAKIKEGFRLKVSCYEATPELIKALTGMGTLATAVQTSTSITGEQKILNSTNWAELYGENISAVTVTDGGATPVTYVLTTDYVLDTTNGLIKRVSTGSIADGGRVYVNYTFTKGARKTLTFPVTNTVHYIPVRFIIERDDGRLIVTIPKAVPPDGASTWDLNFNEFHALDVEFVAEVDLSRNVDDSLAWIDFIANAT